MGKSLRNIILLTLMFLGISCTKNKDDGFIRVVDFLHNENLTRKKIAEARRDLGENFYNIDANFFYRSNGTRIDGLGEKEAEQILKNLKKYISTEVPDSVNVEYEYNPSKGVLTINPSEGYHVSFFDLIKEMDLKIALTYDNIRGYSYNVLEHKSYE